MINSSGNTPCSLYDLRDPTAPVAAMDASLVQETPISSSLLYNFSMLKEKINQVQSLVSILISPDQSQQSMAIASMNSLVQEIMVTASSLMFVCQQVSLSATPTGNNENNAASNADMPQTYFYSTGNENVDAWYDNCNNDHQKVEIKKETNISGGPKNEALEKNVNSDIIELDAADLLAKYTHYCQVCGKGFKRDANLRMHMRAHGDEYKTSAALSNPMKKSDGFGGTDVKCSTKSPKKYSCPFQGCRWNQRHAKFQPLKSMICVKNHYKRSHCPKMYVCKRCNRKQFSVLSDLRTHEKHCGDLKWQCSCGTTFSRKDKLMGHVALFVGHAPVVATSSLNVAAGSGFEQKATQMQVDDRLFLFNYRAY